jgi:transcription elongation factor Elf1
LDKRNSREISKDRSTPVKIGNKNKTGECGMCGVKVKKTVSTQSRTVDFMICGNCKSIMNMGEAY